MNIVTLIGRTTSDIECKVTTSGKSVCSFTLAVNKNFNREEANFIPVVFFGKQAEVLSVHVKKGQQIGVSGELTSRQYEVDGKKRTVYEVVGSAFDFCERKSDNTTNSYPPAQTAPQGEYEEIGEDDLPF